MSTTPSHIVFIPVKKYIKYFSGTTRIDSWKSNGLSEENIENIMKSESNFRPTFVDHHLLSDINFNGQCLINNNLSIPKLNSWLRNLIIDFTLTNCLFGSVKVTKTVTTA